MKSLRDFLLPKRSGPPPRRVLVFVEREDGERVNVANWESLTDDERAGILHLRERVKQVDLSPPMHAAPKWARRVRRIFPSRAAA